MKRMAGLILGWLLFAVPAWADPIPAAPISATEAPASRPAGGPSAEGPFADWAAVVIAGDWHAHSGGPTEAFDNARRDVSLTLAKLGFSPDAIRQYSARPKRYPAVKPAKTDWRGVHSGLGALARANTAGCLFYITSHGAPEGVLLDKGVLPPHLLAALIDDACPARPSIVVISACFSGVFVQPLQKDDRMILTAARPDRASFGCSEDDKYPYFDDCFLSSAPASRDFAALGRAVQACVAERERDTGSQPPSEPQLWIGGRLRPLLPLYAFPRAAPSRPASAPAAR